jgi:hypothetical protein
MNTTITSTFLTVNYSLVMVLIIIGLLCAITIIIMIAIHRPSHTVTYLLAVNVSVASCFYFIICLYNNISALFFQANSTASCTIVSYIMMSSAASIAYALMLQSISRLFFIVFYRHQQLLTFKAHILLILSGWFISFTFPPLPLFFLNAFIYIPSLNLCIIDSTSAVLACYAMISACFVPYSFIGLIYFYIMCFIRKQRSVRPFAIAAVTITAGAQTLNTKNRSKMNSDRNLRVLQNIMISVTITTVTGLPSLVITLLILIGQAAVELSVYCTLFTILGVLIMTITSFFLTKNVQKTFLNSIRCFKQ